MIKISIHQEDIAITNIYTANNMASKYKIKKITNFKKKLSNMNDSC